MARPTKVKPPANARPQGVVPTHKDLRFPVWKAACLLLLTGVSASIYQLSLSPSHGSIPAAQYRTEVAVVFVTLALVARSLHWSGFLLQPSKAPFLTAILATWTPLLQFVLAPAARFVGPALGAALVNALTLGPMVTLAVNAAVAKLETLVAMQQLRPALPLVFCLVSAAALALTARFSDEYIQVIVGSHPLLSRPILPFVLPPLMVLLFPSQRLVWLAALPYALLWTLIPHTSFSIATPWLDRSMHDVGYTVLRREESLTGYLAVVENSFTGYRILRCDHSILGGEWILGLGGWPGGEGYDGPAGIVAEPVYAIFVMLEAVRLVQDDVDSIKGGQAEDQRQLGPMVLDGEARALVIGLGIGTTPSALIYHGINTTVVEIDPMIHRLALDHFKLPRNHTAYIEDATTFVKNGVVEMAQEIQSMPADSKGTAKVRPGRYDYIVHDVFTGGAEPVELFTEAFLRGLSFLLRPDGVIAINYASDLYLPSASYVFTTVLSVFPNCRLFRETDPAETSASNTTSDFANMVLFCRKTKKPFTFRQPSEADCLGSEARRMLLMPKHEIPLEKFVGHRQGGEWRLDEDKILTRDRVKELEQWHAVGAARHWELMRTVIPDIVWERW